MFSQSVVCKARESRSIDYAYYDKRARQLRSAAVRRGLGRMWSWWRRQWARMPGQGGGADRVRSVPVGK